MDVSPISFQLSPMHLNSLSLCMLWAEHFLLEEWGLNLSAQKDILRICFLESDRHGQPPLPTPSSPGNLIAWNVLITIPWLQGAAWMSVSQLASYWGSKAGCLGAQDVFFGRNPLPWISFLRRRWWVGSHFGCDCWSLFFPIHCSVPLKTQVLGQRGIWRIN